MWGVGPVAEAKLRDEGYHHIGQLAEAPGRRWSTCLAKLPVGNCPPSHGIKTHAGSKLVIAPGRSAPNRRWDEGGQPMKLSSRFCDIWPTAWAPRLRAKSLSGQTVTVRVRFAEMQAVARSLTLNAPKSATATVAEIAEESVETALTDYSQERTIALLVVRTRICGCNQSCSLNCFVMKIDNRARDGALLGGRLTAPMDAVRKRFGRDAVGYATAQFDRQRLVPEVFRELAERISAITRRDLLNLSQVIDRRGFGAAEVGPEIRLLLSARRANQQCRRFAGRFDIGRVAMQ